MAFTKINRKPSGRGNFATNTVRVRSREKQVEFTMSGDVWEALGSPAKMAVLVGTGPHSGRVALEADESVDAYKVQKGHFRTATRFVPIARMKMGLPMFAPIAVRFRIKGSRLVITLPSIALEKNAAAPCGVPLGIHTATGLVDRETASLAPSM